MPDRIEAVLRARLQTLVGADASGPEYATLLADVEDALGAGHSLAFEVRFHRENADGRGRPLRESLERWTRLCEQAAEVLPDSDRAFADIESSYVRHLRIYGEFGALDRVVALRARRLAALRGRAAGDDLMGPVRTDLAVALIDRGRFGHLDPLVTDPTPGDDLRRALSVAAEEESRRAAAFTPRHPFTWHARAVATAAAVSLAIRGGREPELRKAADAAAELVAYHRTRNRDVSLMRAKLLRAEALDALGEHREAEREATSVTEQWLRREEGFDPGRPLLVLARAQARRAPDEALANAELALRSRELEFPRRGHKVAEARHLITALRAASSGLS